MFNRGQLILGSILLLLGIVFLIGSVFRIDIWAYCWPVGLILVGVWLVMRPTLSEKGSEVLLLGDLRRRGNWAAKNEEVWLGIGDVDLDYTEAIMPAGETKIGIYGFVGDVDVLVPRSVGVAIHAAGFLVDSELLGRDYETFFSPVDVTSENYASAETRLRIDMTGFVVDIKVKQV